MYTTANPLRGDWQYVTSIYVLSISVLSLVLQSPLRGDCLHVSSSRSFASLSHYIYGCLTKIIKWFYGKMWRRSHGHMHPLLDNSDTTVHMLDLGRVGYMTHSELVSHTHTRPHLNAPGSNSWGEWNHSRMHGMAASYSLQNACWIRLHSFLHSTQNACEYHSMANTYTHCNAHECVHACSGAVNTAMPIMHNYA